MTLALAVCCRGGVVQMQQSVTNPFSFTDIPDNDVIRVGEDFYMISTTMYFTPGAPIMHSRDLVHWETVSYIFDLLEDDAIYRMEDGANAYGAGQWATSLRYHEGWYYALFVANDQQKSYLYKTQDIVEGPWERYVFDEWFFHDPSLLFDDGRLYVVWGNGELRLTELSPDGSKVIGKEEVIVSTPSENMGLRAEGAHFYHIGDYYYIIEIDWPEDAIRQVTCWRSTDIKGPYESKVVLCGTLDGREKDGIAQGPIVDTPEGDWYAIQFQDHGAIGRIPTIQPVTWTDGWPIMGDGGVPMQEVTVNLPASGREYVWDSDDFTSDKLALVWQWNHKAPQKWSLTEKPGWLTIYSSTANRLSEARGTLTQRTVGPRCRSSVLLDWTSLGKGTEAGICAFQSKSGRIGVKDGHLVVNQGDKTVFSTAMEGNGLVYLAISYVFTPQEEGDKADTATFSYSMDGENWTTPDFTLEMEFTLDYFTGYRTGLYCFGADGKAQFDWFKQEIF